MSSGRAALPRFAQLVLLLLLVLVLGLYACPPAASLDDDDIVQPDDDDDDDDDDDTGGGGDDDDFTIPDGLPIGGNLLWQPSDGAVPAAQVRVGLFHVTAMPFNQAESFGALVAEEGLSGGSTIYTVYIKGEPESAEMIPFAEDSITAALYLPIAYIDENQDEGYDAGELLLGMGDSLVVFMEDLVPFPSALSGAGAGPGWNLLEVSYFDAGVMDFSHVPEGTNSSNGPSISSDLLPNMGGMTSVRTDVVVPEGGVVAAWHWTAFTDTPVTNYEQFVTAASNEAAPGGTLLGWTVEGEPPSAHIGVLPPPVGEEAEPEGGEATVALQGALYEAVVYFDDGDSAYTPSSCDTLLAAGNQRTLLWMEPSTLRLSEAFALQRAGQPLGWSLYDEPLDTWRPLAVGIDLLPSPLGDDDDSAGGDAAEIPPDCLGDDDDSAGDDDDSADAPLGG